MAVFQHLAGTVAAAGDGDAGAGASVQQGGQRDDGLRLHGAPLCRGDFRLAPRQQGQGNGRIRHHGGMGVAHHFSDGLDPEEAFLVPADVE